VHPSFANVILNVAIVKKNPDLAQGLRSFAILCSDQDGKNGMPPRKRPVSKGKEMFKSNHRCGNSENFCKSNSENLKYNKI